MGRVALPDSIPDETTMGEKYNPAMEIEDQSIADEVVTKCEHLSGYIQGHLHSDALGTELLKPETLLREIQDFDSLRKD